MEPLKCGPCKKCQKRVIEMQSSKLWNYGITDEAAVSDSLTSECIAKSNSQKTANLSVESNNQIYDQIGSRSVTEIRETRSNSQGQKSKDEENGFRFSESSHSKSELKNMQENDPDIGPIYRWVTTGNRLHGNDATLESPETSHYWILFSQLLKLGKLGQSHKVKSQKMKKMASGFQNPAIVSQNSRTCRKMTLI